MFNDVQTKVIMDFETVLLNKSNQFVDVLLNKFGFNKPFIAGQIKNRLPKVLDGYFDKLETMLGSVMNEDGTIDGTLLNELLKEKGKKLTTIINIPNSNINLMDYSDSFFNSLTSTLKMLVGI